MQFIKARNLDVRKRISLQKFFEKNEHRANDRDSPFRSLLLGLRNSSGSPFHSKTTHMGFIGQCTLHVIPTEVEESLTTSEGRRNNKEYRTRTICSVRSIVAARLWSRLAARFAPTNSGRLPSALHTVETLPSFAPIIVCAIGSS